VNREFGSLHRDVTLSTAKGWIVNGQWSMVLRPPNPACAGEAGMVNALWWNKDVVIINGIQLMARG
jgi:hypothetical protein